MLLLSCGDGLRFSVAICRRRFAIACLLPLFALLPQSAQAANRTWGNTGTNFNSGTSWSGGTAPGSSDTAVFSSAAITQPNVSGSLTIQELNFSTTSSSGYDLTSSNTGVKLTLAGANTYSGETTLASGTTLRINNATALGTGTFTINGGTIDNTTAGSLTLTNNNTITLGGSFTFGGTKDLNFGTGAITNAGNR